MKKCSIYLDFVNSDTFDENDMEAMKDVIAHTLHCTDCSYDRRVREELTQNLRNYPEPDYPENLHELAVNIDYERKPNSNEQFDYINRFFMNLLKPMEVAIPLACVVVLCCMIQINDNSSNDGVLLENYQKPNVLQKIKIAEASDNINENGLQKVSSEEVKEFLAKLDEFERLHPESKTLNKIYKPDIRLVGH